MITAPKHANSYPQNINDAILILTLMMIIPQLFRNNCLILNVIYLYYSTKQMLSGHSNRQPEWIQAIEMAINTHGIKYDQLVLKRKGSFMLVVYIKSDLKHQIHELSTDSSSTHAFKKVS